MNDWQCAAGRLAAWLDDHFGMDGRCALAPADPRYYPKAPYLLAAAGLHTKAARAAQVVRDEFIDDNGDFRSPDPVENCVYAMGWLLLGAVATRRYDLARVLAARLEERQDRRSGGVLIQDDAAQEAVAEVCFSGGVGMGLAAAGRVEPARRMADRFICLLDAQPDPACYYHRFRADGSVLARAAQGAWTKVYDLARDEQRPANFATVVNTLVWVGRWTGDPAYPAAARRYVDLVYRHRLDPAQFGRATKFGWAMLNLREDTGDADLLTKACRLGEVLVAQQASDGLWDPRPHDNARAPSHLRLSYSSDCAMTILALAQLPDIPTAPQASSGAPA